MAQRDIGPGIVHASAVAVDTSGLLILGASGAGKSSLALEMRQAGGDLVIPFFSP